VIIGPASARGSGLVALPVAGRARHRGMGSGEIWYRRASGDVAGRRADHHPPRPAHVCHDQAARWPYRRVIRRVEKVREQLIGRALREDVTDPATGEVIARRADILTEEQAERLAALPDAVLGAVVPVVPTVTNEIEYLSADVEDRFIVAQANAPVDDPPGAPQRRQAWPGTAVCASSKTSSVPIGLSVCMRLPRWVQGRPRRYAPLRALVTHRGPSGSTGSGTVSTTALPTGPGAREGLLGTPGQRSGGHIVAG
jgi:hypothetical protein